MSVVFTPKRGGRGDELGNPTCLTYPEGCTVCPGPGTGGCLGGGNVPVCPPKPGLFPVKPG